jgi:hypothetical protein
MSTELSTQLTNKIEFADTPLSPNNGVNKKLLYVLWHRENSNPHPLSKYFWHEGDLRSAIARGKNHCEKMGIRFIFVRPFLSDLEADEKRHTGTYE